VNDEQKKEIITLIISHIHRLSFADAFKVAAVQPVHNAGHVQQYEKEMPHRMQL